ncbi:MAG: aminoglycoside phosphotransferase family protein [Pseudonocardiaceae bacterium]
MDVEEITERLVRRFGVEVTGWCTRVPVLADELAGRWSLTLGVPLAAGASSVVLGCRLADGTAAVLKLSPDPEFLAEQVAMLGWLGPSGRVPGVFAADREGVLMEAVEPGTMADELPRPPTAAQWSQLLTALHGIDPPPDARRSLLARCEEFFTRIGRRLTDPRIAARISPEIWNRALDRCRHLVATASDRVMLHGDLHLGNVLDAGPSGGLIAIDPKVCVGDPCFDAVDYLLAAAGTAPDHSAVTTRCQALADIHGLDEDRLHDWCRAIAPVIAVSLLTNPTAEHAVAELLTLAH